MVFDRQGRCLKTNSIGIILLGYEECNVLNKNFPDIWPENIRETVNEAFKQTLEGKPSVFEADYLRPDGGRVFGGVRLNPIFDKNGKVNMLVAISTDITRCKQVEEEVMRHREHLQKLVDERTLQLKAAMITSEEEKATAEAIIAAIGDGISIRDTNYKLLYQNQVSINFIGDHVGEFCYKAFHRIDQICEGCPVERSFKDGKVHTTDKSVLIGNSIQYVENTASPLRDSTGKIIAGIEVVRDTTIRKNADEELRKSNERLNAVLEASPAAIITMNPEGIVTIWNKSAERIFGWSKEEAIGKFYPVVPQDKREEFRSLRERVLRGELLFDVEVRRQKKDGSPVDINISASPLRNSRGEINGMLAVVNDIMERKQAEQEISSLASIIQTMPDAVCSIDLDGNILSWNRGAEIMLGYLPEEILGKPLKTIIPGKLGQTELEHYSDILNTDGYFTGYASVRRAKDGRIVPVEITAVALRDIDQNIIRYASIARDVTERKKAERHIKLAYSELKQIFNTSVDGMVVIDKDFNMLRINETFLSLLGCDRNEITGKKCHEILLSASLCHTENCPMARILSGEEYVEFETEKTRKDGVNIPCIVTATPFKNPDGEIIGIVEDIRDITERKKMEENILKIRKLESIGILAGGIAHDFNNLLQVILGYIGFAKMFVRPEDKIYNALTEAETASNQAKELSYRLITFAKGGEPLKKLAAIKTLLSESVSYALSYTNISCEFDVPDDLYTVEIDSGQIRQVIHNLLLNAKEAMPDGGTINVSAKNFIFSGKEDLQLTEGRYVKISIEDHGEGISGEILARIFDPYFTTKGMGSQKGGGLGLAICYSIIKKHGGAITVESIVGLGTTFYVYLPASEK